MYRRYDECMGKFCKCTEDMTNAGVSFVNVQEICMTNAGVSFVNVQEI
jgi:hypothetical protein